MKICCVKNECLNKNLVSRTCALKNDFFAYVKDSDVLWIERALAENNPAYKQLIPYILIKNSCGSLLTYRRHGSEKRLSGLYSCGIGGHIDESDRRETLKETLERGMLREIREEITNFDPDKIKPEYKGIIFDNESEVGRVHLGLVYLAECPEGFTPLPSEEISGAEWKTPEELAGPGKETWSELAFSLLA